MSQPAGWYPERPGSTTLRWWDGNQWTHHTQQAQQQAQQQAPGQASDASAWEVEVGRGHDPDRVRRQVQQTSGGPPVHAGGGTLFSEPVLVVNQRVKLIEMANEYAVFDQHGRQLGAVVQVGQSTLKKAVRFLGSYDQFMTHKLELRDNSGQTVLRMTRPAKVFKSRVVVGLPTGQPVGEIVQENMIGKIRFGFVVGGQQIGGIQAENWRAWNFMVHDHTGQEVARITKTWEGFAKTMFTTADNYVVQIHRQLPNPLLSLVVASALTVDTALKQDDRGFG